MITFGSQLADDLFTLFQTTRQPYADKNAGVSGIGITVVKLGNRTSAQHLAELQEATLLLGNGDRQQRLALFAQLAAFRNVAQAVEIDVGTGQNMRQPLTLNVMLLDILFHARQRQRTRRLRYRAHILKQIFHGCADGIAVDGDDVINILLTESEGFAADTLDRNAFGKQPDAR